MALTRAMLKGMGLTDEQVGAIIEEHTNVTGDLKEKIKNLEESVTNLEATEKELNDLKKEVEKDKAAHDDLKKKYDEEHKSFEDYKKDAAAKETSAKIRSKYRKLLIDSGIGEKHVDTILNVTKFDEMKLDDDENLADVEKLTAAIKEKYSGFIVTTEETGAGVSTPPGGKGSDEGNGSRAKELAAKYHDSRYGKVKEE